MANAPDFRTLTEPSIREQLVALMDQARHEDALALLYRARAADPENSKLREAIDHLKALLFRAYATQLGGLDRVAPPLPEATPRSADVLMLARYVDGTSTFGDIAEIYPLGRLKTLQLLVKLYGAQNQRSASRPDTSTSWSAPDDYPVSSALRSKDEDDEPSPQTARSPSSTGARGLGATRFSDPESEDARHYKATFALGTTAFVQERYQEAVEAFGLCAELRENDPAAAVMLRRSLQGLKSQVT